MSFLNQLKSQANALQQAQSQQSQSFEANAARCEAACGTVFHYFNDLAKQLNVLSPAAPKFTVDGKTPWPPMKLHAFRVDARKKMLRDRELHDYLVIGWEVVPQSGAPVGGMVSVNFPPDLERVESRLSIGQVPHERKEVRHPEKNSLQAFRFEYLTRTRGSVTVTPDHETGSMSFRLANLQGFGLANTQWPAQRLQPALLDELAKLIVSQPSTFM